MNGNLDAEILTELSWIMSAIDAISSKIGVETYETTLIKYRVQPEEEQAISKFIAFHVQDLNSVSFDNVRNIVSKNFFDATKKNWTLPDDVLKKLIDLRRTELEI